MSDEPLLTIVDLFCGGGGFTTGLIDAVLDHYEQRVEAETGVNPNDVTQKHPRIQYWVGENLEITAVNHDDHAVATYRANHPYADVRNSKVQSLHPPDAVDGNSVDILIGGPSCVPHSRAKGGMASDDQLRHSPHHLLHWLELLRPAVWLVENVPPFEKWGPMDFSGDEPQMKKNGELFEQWVNTLRTLGYTVDWETFVASDYGVPQSRKRLFVQGRLNYEPAWPEPTHSENGEKPGTEPHKTAASIIDWDDIGNSLWGKSRPLVQNTNRRIAQGLREFGHDALEPFADVLAELTKEDIKQMQQDAVSISEASEAAERRDSPFFVEGPVYAGPVDDSPSKHTVSLCDPQVMHGCSGGKAKPATENPVPTVTAKGGVIHYVNPQTFILPRNGRQRGLTSNPGYKPDDKPLHTVTAQNHDGRKFDSCLVPLYTEQSGEHQNPERDELPQVPLSEGPGGISDSFLVKYYGNSDAANVDNPMPTVTTTNSLALCVPECYPWGIDIRYRMLNQDELARSQGFDDSYEFTPTTKKDTTKLIGNAVPVGLAEAMTKSLLTPTSKPTLNTYAEGPQPVATTEE